MNIEAPWCAGTSWSLYRTDGEATGGEPYVVDITDTFMVRAADMGVDLQRVDAPIFSVAAGVNFSMRQRIIWLRTPAPVDPADLDRTDISDVLVEQLASAGQKYVYKLLLQRPLTPGPVQLISDNLRLIYWTSMAFDPVKHVAVLTPDPADQERVFSPDNATNCLMDQHPPCCRCGLPIDWTMTAVERANGLPYTANPLCTTCYASLLP